MADDTTDRKLLVQIEHYQDEEPSDPAAWLRFLNRVNGYRASQEHLQFATHVFDSVTSAEIMARKYAQYVLNPTAKDPRQWYGSSTDTLEENLYLRFGAFRTNVVVVAHLNEDKDEVSGMFVRNPAAPGRLSKRLPAGYAELYYQYVSRDETGQLVRSLQTANDGRMNANTAINAPNPCAPQWKDLWTGWNGNRKPPTHALVYGDSGVGKSTFAATWPKPMLVYFFDGIGKDVPYLRRGDPDDGEWREDGVFVQRVYQKQKAAS